MSDRTCRWLTGPATKCGESVSPETHANTQWCDRHLAQARGDVPAAERAPAVTKEQLDRKARSLFP